MLGAAAMVFVGVEAVTFGFLAKVFGSPRVSSRWTGSSAGRSRSSGSRRGLRSRPRSSWPASVSAARWFSSGADSASATCARADAARDDSGVLLLLLGAHGILASFLLSMLGMARR